MLSQGFSTTSLALPLLSLATVRTRWVEAQLAVPSSPVTSLQGPGQWWQNLRLPYYAMLRSGDADMFKPLLRWYLALLPMARKRTQLW